MKFKASSELRLHTECHSCWYKLLNLCGVFWIRMLLMLVLAPRAQSATISFLTPMVILLKLII